MTARARLSAVGIPVALALAAIAPSAHAQVRIQAKRPPIGIRLFGVAFETQRMTASQTFDAVTGSAQVNGFGGGVDVLRLAGDLFIRGGLTWSKSDGSRVIVVDDDVISLGIPTTVTLMPIEIGAGWRFTPKARRGSREQLSRFTPYVGGGLVFYRFKEVSEFDEAGEGEFESFSGYHLFGGLDIDLTKTIFAGVEAAYRSVPDALGVGGASELFEETDLGGFAIRFIIGWRK
jgi:opacity protein-like surface antigen